MSLNHSSNVRFSAAPLTFLVWPSYYFMFPFAIPLCRVQREGLQTHLGQAKDQVAAALRDMPKRYANKIKDLDPAFDSQQDREGEFPSREFGEKELKELEALKQRWQQDLNREEDRAKDVRRPIITINDDNTRNQFNTTVNPSIPSYVGNIVNLACVDDADIAHLLSHHLGADMAIVVIEDVGPPRTGGRDKCRDYRLQFAALGQMEKRGPLPPAPSGTISINGDVRRYRSEWAVSFLKVKPEYARLNLDQTLLRSFFGNLLLIDTQEEADVYAEAVRRKQEAFRPHYIRDCGKKITRQGVEDSRRQGNKLQVKLNFKFGASAPTDQGACLPSCR